MLKQFIVIAALLLPASAFAQLPAGGCAEVPGQGQVCSVPYTFNGGLTLGMSTVAGLSAFPCNASTRGDMRAVSDATAPTYNGALTGGGAVVVPIFCNGTAWVSH